MTKVNMFNNISLDGYFTDRNNDMSWAHGAAGDTEFNDFISANARASGAFVFGRRSYEMMEAFWTTPIAARQMPDVAKAMNRSPKYVFSRSLQKANWANTGILTDDPSKELSRLKRQSGPNLTVLGSGSIVSQLAAAGLIDDYQLMIWPVILGSGRTLFEGNSLHPVLKLMSCRVFASGRVFLHYTV
jgi:dihydrofolate reductase